MTYRARSKKIGNKLSYFITKLTPVRVFCYPGGKFKGFADGIHSLHWCRTKFQDMTMTRWRERGLGAHWWKMAANSLIGSPEFRRQFSVGGDAGWRETNEALSGAHEFCYGNENSCLPPRASFC